MRLDHQDSQTDDQKPIKQSLCRSLVRDTHWKCLILSMLIYSCLTAIAWCRLSAIAQMLEAYSLESTQERLTASPCDDGYVYIPVAFVIMLYLVYLVECWHCHTRIELQYKVDVNNIYERIQLMREALPIIWWKAVCYHYVRRTRQVTRYRNGDAFTTTQVYYERINTHTAGSAFNFCACGVKDVSKQLTELETYPATKIKFSKGFSFANWDAENEFEEQRAQFFQEHERRDDYMETREGMDLLNVSFKGYLIAFADPDHLPWYVSHLIFWVASVLLLSWPLRVVIEYKTAHVHYHIHKLFGDNYNNNNSAMNGTISRVNTFGSADLEATIRNNYVIVPSYSEALLMDPAIARPVQDDNANFTMIQNHRAPLRSITFNSFILPSQNMGLNDSLGSAESGVPNGSMSSRYFIINQNYALDTGVRDDVIGIDNDTPPLFRRSWRRKLRRKKRWGSSLSTPDFRQLSDSQQTAPLLADTDSPLRRNRSNTPNSSSFHGILPRVSALSTETIASRTTIDRSDSSITIRMDGQQRVCSPLPVLIYPCSSPEEPPPAYEDAIWMRGLGFLRSVGRHSNPFRDRIRQSREHISDQVQIEQQSVQSMETAL